MARMTTAEAHQQAPTYEAWSSHGPGHSRPSCPVRPLLSRSNSTFNPHKATSRLQRAGWPP